MGSDCLGTLEAGCPRFLVSVALWPLSWALGTVLLEQRHVGEGWRGHRQNLFPSFLLVPGSRGCAWGEGEVFLAVLRDQIYMAYLLSLSILYLEGEN